ncbi:PREDICTED: uncharacterized protein LOC106745998 [Dinoponera quadriceps]|uniref:Uncharacterized protein LOC106745998 n=1 Tax=Dinoponera quadriceps TaxID=609295 RepID=A0A6P3XH80_DINQU|nr:PREDICTED: uncharacterized protein LOC106745998 [Dinoponera quadriceps]
MESSEISTLYQQLASSEAALYNKSFNPNVCHVCKFKSREGYKTCEICETNLYCSLEHKMEDQLYHRQICQAIRDVETNHLHLYRLCKEQEEWINLRKECLRLIKEKLSRDLEPYEVQMIMFKQSCFICHIQCNLSTCTTCYSINYCPNHKENFKHFDHVSNCKDLKLCLNIDIALRYNSPSPRKFIDFPEKGKPFVDMDSFLTNYLANVEFEKYFYSDYVSGPLTLYYGMYVGDLNFLGILSYFTVLIIAANFLDKEYSPAWELFMHIFNKIENLTIILIGPELQNKYYDITTCNRKCLSFCKRKKLNFECYHMSYYEYVNSTFYRQPNVIVGYQTDFNDWEETSLSNCPLFLTTKSKLKANQNINKLQKVSNTHLNIIYHEENTFSSKRPYKDFETNGVFYRNKFLTVCTN